MAFDVYTTVFWLHVVASTVVVGLAATFPMLRASARKNGDPAVVRHNVVQMKDLLLRLMAPALALLVVTGLLMTLVPLPNNERVVYPFSANRWVVSGTILWAAITFVFLVSGLTALRKLQALPSGGASTEDPAAANASDEAKQTKKLWSDWRVAALFGALLALAAVFLMVYKPYY